MKLILRFHSKSGSGALALVIAMAVIAFITVIGYYMMGNMEYMGGGMGPMPRNYTASSVLFPWPAGKGYNLFREKCDKCHGLNRIERYGYHGKTYGNWSSLIINQMKDANGASITVSQGEEIAAYLSSLNIIAYNETLARQHKEWTNPPSLPWKP